MMESFKALGSYAYVLIAFFGIGIVYFIFFMMHQKKRQNNYLQKYPNAVKVYAKTTNVVVANSQIIIHSVDGEAPAYFTGGTYVKPGHSILEVHYEGSRVGVLYKEVRTSTETVKLEVDLEEGKEYIISFDKKSNQFVVSEKQ